MAAFEDIFGDEENKKEEKITINKKYAVKFQKFKEAQELDRLKQKYGDVSLKVEESDDSSSESEDDHAEALTPQLEQDFLTTLAMIKSKDPKIYEKETVFYKRSREEDENLAAGTSAKNRHQKPLYLKDYERQQLLEKGHKAFVSDSEDEEESNKKGFVENIKKEELTYNEEQEQLKKSLKEAIVKEEEDSGELLQIRVKSSAEKEEEEREYQEWYEEEKKINKDLLNRYWTSDELDPNEQFLRDYILKKHYIDHDDDQLPSYKDIVGGLDTDDENEDDDNLEKEEEFERKFNFRYEEPDQEFIKRYPRTVTESVRRKDDRRVEKRKEREKRKSKEKDKKREELKKLKRLKRKEIMEKIEKLKEITGNEKVGFLEEDIDIDFNGKQYDEIMQKVFDTEYYEGADDKKPIFSDDEEMLNGYCNEENWDEWEGNYEEDWNGNGDKVDYDVQAYEPHCEDADFNMDADYIPTETKKKKISKFAQALNKKKPVFDPDEKTFEQYFDEYYKLDFEDIIGDLPVRFKYRNVIPNDFGLSTEEVLKADDKELNSWCSLKKTMRYYTEEEERTERLKYKKKARNKRKKFQALPSLAVDNEESEDKEQMNHNDKSIDGKILKNKEKYLKLNKINNFISKKRNKLSSKYSLHNKLHSSMTFNKKLRHHSSMTFNKKLRHQSNSKRDSMSNTKLKKLHKQFKGVDSKKLSKLPASRLAAYGLDKRKKKSE